MGKCESGKGDDGGVPVDTLGYLIECDVSRVDVVVVEGQGEGVAAEETDGWPVRVWEHADEPGELRGLVPGLIGNVVGDRGVHDVASAQRAAGRARRDDLGAGGREKVEVVGHDDS